MILSGCCSMSDIPRTQLIHIDTNVEASVYVDDVFVGKTPYSGQIERKRGVNIELKSYGYKTEEVPLEYHMHRKVAEKMNIKDFTIGFFYNVVTLFVPSIIGFFDYINGRWVDYTPDVYFVEMYPQERKTKN